MRPVRAALPILALLCTVTAALAAPPSDDVIRQKIVGSWGQSAACEEGRLTFNADGTFTSGGGNPDNDVSGTYAISQGQLTGHSGETAMPAILVDFDGDTLVLDDGSGNPDRLDRCPAQ